MKLNRRNFTGGALAAFASGCATSSLTPEIPKYLLNGYKGIADLPYYELDELGRPVLTQRMRETLPKGVDFHTHFGLSLLMSPDIDYHAHHDESDYLINCKADDPRCEYNLNDYLNKIAKPELLSEMNGKIAASVGPGGSDASRSHTIPGLMWELDQNNLETAVVLAVAPRLPFRNNPTEKWFKAAAESEHRDRMIMFCAVHPREDSAKAKLKEYAAMGARGVKLHPPMQQFSPDDKEAMELFEVCEELGLMVFFHAGRAGIEPKYSAEFARMKHYIAPARAFPNLQFIFGHAGARDWREALAIAKYHENVWLEIEGQGVYELNTIQNAMGSDRLLFGSDYPFYPVSASMARVLIATEKNQTARDNIIAHNAHRLLAMS